MAIVEPIEDAFAVSRSSTKRRRRPSGEPPPLPRSLRSTGVYWLGMLGLLVLGWMVIAASFSASMKATEFDTAVLQALADMRTEWMDKVARAFHALGSEWLTLLLRWGSVLALLFF